MVRSMILIMALIALSEENKPERSSRQKRYIYINPSAPITLGFILNMPISLALPTLIVEGRSLQAVNTLDLTDDTPESLFYDPNYEEPLSRLTLYFNYMAIPSLSCHERIICELASSPEDYSPVAEIFMREIRQSYGPVDKTDDSLMWRYLKAARTGYTSSIEECAEAYVKCPEPAHKLLNMSVIKVWQFIARTIGLQLI